MGKLNHSEKSYSYHHHHVKSTEKKTYSFLFLLMTTTQEAFVASVDQDQTAQKVQSVSDLHCPHFAF